MVIQILNLLMSPDMGQALSKVFEAQAQSMCFIKKVLEAQFKHLQRAWSTNTSTFWPNIYSLASVEETEILNGFKSFIKFYCKYLLLHLTNISLKNAA